MHAPPYRDPLQGGWVVTRHADALRILKDPATRVQEGDKVLARFATRLGRPMPGLQALYAGTLLLQNPPHHAACRALLRSLVGTAASRWPQQALQAEAEAVLARLPAGECADIMPALTALPATVAADTLDIPVTLVAQLRTLTARASDAWRARSVREYLELEECASEALALLDDAGLRTGSAVLQGERAALVQAVPAHLLRGTLLFFIMSSIETSAGLLGNAVALLCREQPLQEQVRSEPGLVDAFVDEALRYCGPVRRLTPRVLAHGMEFDHVQVPAGEPVLIRLDLVHRDPSVFEQPDSFNLHRGAAGAIPFIHGPHACLGATAARQQARAVLGTLLATFRLVSADAAPRPSPRVDFEQFESLPVRLLPLAEALR